MQIDAKLFREKVLKHCIELIREARFNFERGNYSLSAFLSITAIEEISKIFYIIRFFSFKSNRKLNEKDLELLSRTIESVNKGDYYTAKQLFEKLQSKLTDAGEAKINAKELKSLLSRRQSKNHVIKQQLGILSSLNINARAYKKLGKAIIQKYIKMAKTGELFSLRNRCLYIDVEEDKIIIPGEAITRQMALELVCLASEVVAELSDMGAYFIGNKDYSQKATHEWLELLYEADEFLKKHHFTPKNT